MNIPLLPLPFNMIRGLVHGIYPVSDLMLRSFPKLQNDLDACSSDISAKEYIGGAIVTFVFYLIAIGFIFWAWAMRTGIWSELRIRTMLVLIAVVTAVSIFGYILTYPRWLVNKIRQDMEKNLLFAARHMMIQTKAGVPLFNSIVSVSEEYHDSNMDYGPISKEFKRIVKEVRSGRELTYALEDSASRNPSPYYKRTVWQLANANKTGTNIGKVLSDVVEFLADEQRIMIRNYGSQLNPLALVYMFTCITMPTMGVIFLAITTTVSNTKIEDSVFAAILIFLTVFQIIFIGLIKSRRPVVSI